jgi:hypothetical protein
VSGSDDMNSNQREEGTNRTDGNNGVKVMLQSNETSGHRLENLERDCVKRT